MKQAITFLLLLVGLAMYSQPYGYQYARPITIYSTAVAGTVNLSNYPYYIHFTNDDFKNTVNGGKINNASGHDIIFTGPDMCTRIPHEIEKYDGNTGELHCWVKLSAMSYSANSTIYIFYGNPTVSAASSTPSQVWNSDYDGVWHLSNTPGSIMKESTAAARHGTCLGSMSSASSTTGIAGNALALDETDDGIQIADFDYTSSFGIGLWFKCSEVIGTSFQYLYSHGPLSTTNSANVYFGEETTPVTGDRKMLKTIFQDNNDGTNFNALDAGTVHVTNTWHQYYLVVGNSGGARVYIDGVMTASYNILGGDAYNPATDIFFGTRNDLSSTRYYGGLIDELRIMNVPPSETWIKTEKENLNPISDSYLLGAQQAASIVCVFLPIELVEFRAEAKNNALELSWTTASETGNDHFLVEQSTDGISFEPIAKLKGAGTTKTARFYAHFTDIPNELTYFRLKQQDFDGTYSYSHLVAFDPGKLRRSGWIYPNPARDIIYVHCQSGKMPVKIYNSTGTIIDSRVLAAENSNGVAELGISHLSPGIYYIEYNTPEPTRTKIVIKP